MALDTKNAGALIGKAAVNGRVTVEILQGTYIASIGADARKGEVVEISESDARYLIPRGMAKITDKKVSKGK